MGRRRTDLSVGLGGTKGHPQKASQDLQSKKMSATDFQKKLTDMIKAVKDEHVRWKEERAIIPPPPPPFFQEEMDQRRIKTTVAGSIAFRGKFKNWLHEE